MLGGQLDSLAAFLEGWIVIISVKGGGLGGCDSVESSSTEWAPEWESERLLKSGEADPECGCGSEVQLAKEGGGGRPASVSEKEEESMALKGTKAILVSVRIAQQDRSFCVAAEDLGEREKGLDSVWVSKSTVALLAGWMTSTSSWSESPCSDRGQNGSSTCRNIRVNLRHTRYGGQTQTPREPGQAGSQERKKVATLILLQQDPSCPVMSVTCNPTQ